MSLIENGEGLVWQKGNSQKFMDYTSPAPLPPPCLFCLLACISPFFFIPHLSLCEDKDQTFPPTCCPPSLLVFDSTCACRLLSDTRSRDTHEVHRAGAGAAAASGTKKNEHQPEDEANTFFSAETLLVRVLCNLRRDKTSHNSNF